MQKVNQVLVVAGTHGNELTGLYLQKLIKAGSYSVERSSFEVKSVVGNPEAVKRNVRFIDVDPNCQFVSAALVEESRETKLAVSFRRKYARVENQLIVDLHNQ
ncbi:succinylglutamate desuccinylase/aspartoacylase family protein [Vibrio neptunius]|uniref:succinylglutamate desuccinylase/aspartoacylase domain-containing protein n=1 Tax=Vibrio neptunius TaxID=170651 RepID=UPI001C5C8A41|nr:succinylglutamate desuccinylase/aspartoacylase family protein [Vibrio neptunius]